MFLMFDNTEHVTTHHNLVTWLVLAFRADRRTNQSFQYVYI